MQWFVPQVTPHCRPHKTWLSIRSVHQLFARTLLDAKSLRNCFPFLFLLTHSSLKMKVFSFLVALCIFLIVSFSGTSARPVGFQQQNFLSPQNSFSLFEICLRFFTHRNAKTTEKFANPTLTVVPSFAIFSADNTEFVLAENKLCPQNVD